MGFAAGILLEQPLTEGCPEGDLEVLEVEVDDGGIVE